MNQSLLPPWVNAEKEQDSGPEKARDTMMKMKLRAKAIEQRERIDPDFRENFIS